jgi:hypothetical protein
MRSFSVSPNLKSVSISSRVMRPSFSARTARSSFPSRSGSGVFVHVLGVALGVMLAGCLQNASPTKKLTDTVHDLNDEARWGRIADASQRVDPSYRRVFMQNHKAWGSTIQIADAEVINLQIAEDGEQAAAFVQYSWYAMKTMTLHQSVVRQRWTSSTDSRGYGLISESVIQGDPRLLGAEAGPGSTAASTMPMSMLDGSSDGF